MTTGGAMTRIQSGGRAVSRLSGSGPSAATARRAVVRNFASATRRSAGSHVARSSSSGRGREEEDFEVEEQRALEELRSEFEKVVSHNFDGLEIDNKDELREIYEDEEDVEIWLEKDRPKRPKVEARQLFEWWNDLEDVYVLMFQLQSEEDGIFTLKDSSEPEANSNYILSFESKEEARSYAKKLSESLQGLRAEIELIERDELLQLCKELEVGIRIVQEGGEEPDIPSYVQVNELDDIRQSLEDLLPDE